MASKSAAPNDAVAKLKIGFIFDDSLDKGDGVQQYILALGSYFASEGHDVHYLVGQTDRNDLKNIHSLSRNVKVSFNGNKMSMPLPANKKRIKALLAKEQFDVLHVQMPHSPYMAQRVILAAPKTTKIIGTFHILPNSAAVTAANKLLKLLLAASLKRINTFVSVSPAAQTFLKKNWGIDSVVLPNVVDVARFGAGAPPKELSDSVNIVFLGRLVSRKGCQHLLAAVKQVVRHNMTNVPFKVVVCGKGPHLKRLQEYVQLNALGHTVQFAGFISENEKPAYLAAADIACFPATGGESFGIVLIEAMAASRGVVLGGNNPGYSSVLGEKPEQLFTPNDEHEFALLLAKYLNAPTKRKAAAEWQHKAVAQYDIQHVAQMLLAIYQAK